MSDRQKMINKIRASILGLAIGDALGVPVEFSSRIELAETPIIGMTGYGAWEKPAGTWSDDTSLTLALADSLAGGMLDYHDIMDKFASWYQDGAYTSDGDTFDVGNTTRAAILNYLSGAEPLECGGRGARDNGNGSLMRILPLVFYFRAQFGRVLTDEGVQIIHEVSALTHAHPRSQVACVAYLNIADHILRGSRLIYAIEDSLREVVRYYHDKPVFSKELDYFRCMAFGNQGILQIQPFANLPQNEIKSGGYVVDTLDATLWCLLNHRGYRKAVLAAVNLGGDTDTTAAVCGGLAGLYHSMNESDEDESILVQWIDSMQNLSLIEDICSRFSAALDSVPPIKS